MQAYLARNSFGSLQSQYIRYGVWAFFDTQGKDCWFQVGASMQHALSFILSCESKSIGEQALR